MTDIELTAKQFSEGSSKQKTHVVASGVGALIGGYLGGYPGMQLGMALGGWLFKPDSSNNKDYKNPDYKLNRSKIESVPDVIGTDICPGRIIYFNKNTFGVYGAHRLPEIADPATEVAWKDFIDALADKQMAYWAEFAVNFAGHYHDTPTNDHHMAVVKFNRKPFWFWMILSDMFENYYDALDPYPAITLFDASHGHSFDSYDIESEINQNVDRNLVMYFRGFIADFSLLSTDPESATYTVDVDNVAEENPQDFPMAALKAMPTFTCEVNRSSVQLSGESMRGGSFVPESTMLPMDVSPYQYSVNLSTSLYWGCRDGRNRFYVGLSDNTYRLPVYFEGNERLLRYPANDGGTVTGDTAPTWFRNNIINHLKALPGISQGFLSATDIHDDRVYVLAFRNWIDPFQSQGALGVDKYEHHHAEYGVEFDLYYHDRTHEQQYVHSVLYGHQYSMPEGHFNPTLYFKHIEVDDTYVYVFGGKNQIDIVLSDQREVRSGDNFYNKVYADFSQYPDGFWEGYYAALGQNDNSIWREITEQTSTYIVISGQWAAFPAVGEVIKVSKYPQWVAEWAIVGEGSTTTKIICNPPAFRSDWIDGSHTGVSEWEEVFYVGDRNTYPVGIVPPIESTVVNLDTPLRRDPVPGERICFTISSSPDFDEDVVNPIQTEYFNTLLDLGFINVNQRASAIKGNEKQIAYQMVWRINKNTGAIDVYNSKRCGPIVEASYLLDWTTGHLYLVYNICSTDKQIFVYGGEGHYGSRRSAYSYIIDFSSGIEEEIHRYREYGAGYASHVPMWIYAGTVVVSEWNFVTLQYEDTWYSVLRVFEDTGTDNGAQWGTYLLKLGEGKFSNKEIDSLFLYGKHGVDIDRRGIQIIFFRRQMTTGPLYMSIHNYGNENEYNIGKFNITEDIYVYINRNEGLGTAHSELWKYVIPTEGNPSGEAYLINKTDCEVSTDPGDDFRYGEPLVQGDFIQSMYGFYRRDSSGDTGRWYQCDESPPQIISDFINYYSDPRYFKDYPTSIKPLEIDDALDICNENIPATIYHSKGDMEITERRFQFSQCYDQPKKMHDVINEVLATCQGFISPCIWAQNGVGGSYVDVPYKLIIPNQNETPVLYFGYDSQAFVSTQLSDEYDRIYGNFSAYPDNYWKGDLVDFGESLEMEDDENPAFFNEFFRTWVDIVEQTPTYLVISDPFVDYFPNSKQFTLKKDNIREGSFVFAEKSSLERPNKVRIEFKNRLLDYVKDIAEAEDGYRLNVLGEEERIDQYKMHGIKRATQAGRMAQRILDQWNHQRFTCAFETDILGMTLCMGDIIGVSHPTTGWSGKWFRIVGMEELMDYEVKFELEEFNPGCYHDNAIPVITNPGGGGFPQPYVPNNVERLEVKEDTEFNRLYFTFKEPTADGGFFVGGRVYRKVGNDWEFVAIVNETVSSVKLAQSVGIDDTTIYYDNTSMSGSFPAQGVIWVENELMYYHGIDTTNYAFTNVVRGYKDTDQVEHTLDTDEPIYIILRDDASVFYDIPDEWAGTTQTFKVGAFTIHNLTVELPIAPTVTIDIVGHGVLPYFPESIQNKLVEFETISESLGLNQGLDETERILESLGLGDAEINEVIVYLTETLGLGDDQYQPDYVNVFESLGLGDQEKIVETLTKLIESLGLGDDEYDPDA